MCFDQLTIWHGWMKRGIFDESTNQEIEEKDASAWLVGENSLDGLVERLVRRPKSSATIGLGGIRMSRRRSKDPTTAISFTIPMRLVIKLDATLASRESRSAWITSAIENKFKGTTIQDASDKQLLAALVNRGVISSDLYATLSTLWVDRATIELFGVMGAQSSSSHLLE